jgi:hypothetical protein
MEVPGRGARVVANESGYHTTLSGKTRVLHPGSYGYRTLYHCADLRAEVGAQVVRRLRAVLSSSLSGRCERSGSALTGEVSTLTGASVATRYRVSESGNLTRTGIAVRLPMDLRARYGTWEHGASLRECKANVAAKRAVIAAEVTAKRRSARDARRERLLARLSCTLTACAADATALGFCVAGIAAWATSRGVDVSGTVPIAVLVRDADPRAVRVALYVARKALKGGA